MNQAEMFPKMTGQSGKMFFQAQGMNRERLLDGSEVG